jgi:hypothetical protein
MLDICRKLYILLNLKKCICFTPFSVLLGHVVYKKGLLVYQENIFLIMDMPPPHKYIEALCVDEDTWLTATNSLGAMNT